jgi:cytochrome c oxidase cbb3-type subunit 3
MKIFDDEKDKLLDHEYDGIRELDNHMPRWWVWLFVFTIFFGEVYIIYYELTIGPNQHQEYAQEMAEAAIMYAPSEEEVAESASFEWVLMQDEATLARGKVIFVGNGQLCHTCHGMAGEGLVGPNLTDEYWMHGCDIESIATSIEVGFPAKGMMAYGSNVKIQDEDLRALVNYIVSIQGSEPANPKVVDMSRAVPCETPSMAAN